MNPRGPVRVRMPVIEFDSPQYWARRPNHHDAHVKAYENALWESYYAWIDDEPCDLWESASDTWQKRIYALMQ